MLFDPNMQVSVIRPSSGKPCGSWACPEPLRGSNARFNSAAALAVRQTGVISVATAQQTSQMPVLCASLMCQQQDALVATTHD